MLAVPQLFVWPVRALYVEPSPTCALPSGPAVVAPERWYVLPPAPVADTLLPAVRCPVYVL